MAKPGPKKGEGRRATRQFSIDELILHLDNEGMDWDKFSETHIDHIAPKSSFKFKDFTDTEFIECWSLNNLRPLSAKENLRKGSCHVKNG